MCGQYMYQLLRYQTIEMDSFLAFNRKKQTQQETAIAETLNYSDHKHKPKTLERSDNKVKKMSFFSYLHITHLEASSYKAIGQWMTS